MADAFGLAFLENITVAAITSSFDVGDAISFQMMCDDNPDITVYSATAFMGQPGYMAIKALDLFTTLTTFPRAPMCCVVFMCEHNSCYMAVTPEVPIQYGSIMVPETRYPLQMNICSITGNYIQMYIEDTSLKLQIHTGNDNGTDQ